MSSEFESEMEEPQAYRGVDPKVVEGLVDSQESMEPRLMTLITDIFSGKIGMRDAKFQLDELLIEQKENLTMMNRIAKSAKNQEENE